MSNLMVVEHSVTTGKSMTGARFDMNEAPMVNADYIMAVLKIYENI
jgi:hypothetical protein